jgi:hypothetical protein
LFKSKKRGIEKYTKEVIKEKQRRAHGECLWLLEAKKDATSCEKPGLGAHNRLIPGYPNGTTHLLQDEYP